MTVISAGRILKNQDGGPGNHDLLYIDAIQKKQVFDHGIAIIILMFYPSCSPPLVMVDGSEMLVGRSRPKDGQSLVPCWILWPSLHFCLCDLIMKFRWCTADSPYPIYYKKHGIKDVGRNYIFTHWVRETG